MDRSLFSRGGKSAFLTPPSHHWVDVGTVRDESSECDRSGSVGVGWMWGWGGVTAGLGCGHSCCCGVWWQWAQVNAWSVPSCSLVGWAGGWVCCPSATVHHRAGGRGYSGRRSSCPSSSSLPLPPDCAVPARPQSWTPAPNSLASPASMPPLQYTTAKNGAPATADFQQPVARTEGSQFNHRNFLLWSNGAFHLPRMSEIWAGNDVTPKLSMYNKLERSFLCLKTKHYTVFCAYKLHRLNYDCAVCTINLMSHKRQKQLLLLLMQGAVILNFEGVFQLKLPTENFEIPTFQFKVNAP